MINLFLKLKPPIPIPQDFFHFVGKWKWEKSKFFSSYTSDKNFDVKYKSSLTENKEAYIEITKSGQLKTYMNNNLIKTYNITDYSLFVEETNSPKFYHYKLKLSTRWKIMDILFYQWAEKDRMSAMYFFPFNKNEGASYNWFYKIK